MLYRLAAFFVSELETLQKPKTNGPEYSAALADAIRAVRALARFW